MSMSVRRLHRRTSIVFLLIVGGIFSALGAGYQPPQWVYYLPLAPLFILMMSGLLLLASPWITAGRARG